MTRREYLEIACYEIGADLADEGLQIAPCWLRNYPQWLDACDEFGPAGAESRVLEAFNARKLEILETLDSELESYKWWPTDSA